MMKFSTLLLSTLILSSSLIADSKSMQIGDTVSTALIQKLGSELKAQMMTNGPVAALGFCNASAQTLTQEVSHSSHYSVKRVSLLDRNPQNRANAQESAILNAWQNTLNTSKPLPSYEIHSDGNMDHYYKPLVINNDMCLKCHGAVDPQSQLGLAIKTAYPNDHAIGYKMGDLRGMIVVDIPLE
jgi:predicted acyltransferase